MPHPTKKQRLEGHQVASADSDFMASFDDLVDVLPNILGFLLQKNIMRKRRVCKNFRDAARRTIVPLGDFSVTSVDEFNAMRVMTTEMPYLQQIRIGYLGWWGNNDKWSEGEDPDEGFSARHAGYTSHPTLGSCAYWKSTVQN